MWVEKRKDKLLACERFFDEILGKNVKLSITIQRDTAQERKKAMIALQERWKALHKKNSDLRLSDIGARYFEDAQSRLKEQTLIRDKTSFRNFQSIVGDAIVDNLSASYIKAKMSESDKPNVTLNGYIKIFKIIMRWAYRNELTDNIQVVDRLEKFPDASKAEKVQDKFLESSELNSLVQGMKTEHWKLLTLFLALTGMRIGEAIALDNSDIDMQTRTISISKTWLHSLRRISSTKTLSSVREIHIQQELVPVIADIMKWSNHVKFLTGERNDIFFPSPYGKRIIYDVYEKYLRENASRILGRPITAHVLRHTFTSVYAEKGLTLDQISRQLGHSNSKITKEVYYHVTQGQKVLDALNLDKISIFAH